MHRLAERLALGLIPLVGHLVPLVAQTWNDPAATVLVRRAVERRQVARADATLTSYRTRAHGFVLYLAQVGEGLTEPPRLIKADELEDSRRQLNRIAQEHDFMQQLQSSSTRRPSGE